MASNFVGSGVADNCKKWDKKKLQYIEVPRPEVISYIILVWEE